MARTVLHADESFTTDSGNFQLVAITENVPGYQPLPGEWGTVALAQEYAQRRNADSGYSHDQVLDIIASSHAASR